MPIYIDTNVFYNAYCPNEERFAADWLLKQLIPEFPGITSEWTIAEMFRALKKQTIPILNPSNDTFQDSFNQIKTKNFFKKEKNSK